MNESISVVHLVTLFATYASYISLELSKYEVTTPSFTLPIKYTLVISKHRRQA